MYRGNAKAFAFDNLGLKAAKMIVQNKDAYMKYKLFEKQFIILPFMHSENESDINMCIQLG